MEHKVSGLGPLAASLIRRAATDWRVVPWVVGGASLLILPAWFAVFREAPQSTLRLPSPRPEAPAPVSAPAVKTGLDGPPVIPEVFARRNPARTAARSGQTRPARPDHGVQTPDEEAASASAPDLPAAGLETPSRRPQFTDALPSRLASSVRSAAAPAGVPLTPFSQQNKASPQQTQERTPGADAPQARVPVRSAAGRAPDAGPAAAAGQTAAASPAGAGQAAQAAAAPGGIASGSGSVSGASAANSGATAAGSESPAVAGYAAAAAAGAAAAGAASGAAATSIAASAKCAETSSYYGPIIQQASREMLALNGQAISCGPTIKCGFASHSYCTEPDSVPLWWKGYYESRCACARVHCKVNEKCEEINSLNCQQLHACPITAAKPCQKSPCDY